jgi:hypothetical protein
MFMYYKNFGSEEMNIHVVRAIVDGDSLNFKEEVIAVNN